MHLVENKFYNHLFNKNVTENEIQYWYCNLHAKIRGLHSELKPANQKVLGSPHPLGHHQIYEETSFYTSFGPKLLLKNDYFFR